MGYLKKDRNGRIYESSPDMADGGFKGYPTLVDDMKDGSLGSAVSKSLVDIQLQQNRTKLQNSIVDEGEWKTDKIYNYIAKSKQQRVAARNKMLQDPTVKANLVKQAVLQGQRSHMGCGHEMCVGLSGNGMSYNGQTGDAGMTPDQRAIKDAVMGNVSQTSFKASALELNQAALAKQAATQLRVQAQATAARQALEYRQLQADKAMKIASVSVTSTVVQPSPLEMYFKNKRGM